MADMTIEAISRLDEQGARALLKKTNLAKLALALRIASREVKHRLFEIMEPARIAALQEINYRLGPTELSDDDALEIDALLRLSDHDMQQVLRQVETWDEIARALDQASPATRLQVVRNAAREELPAFYDAVTSATRASEETCATACDLLLQIVTRLDADGEIAFSGDRLLDQARSAVEQTLNSLVQEGEITPGEDQG